MKKLFLVLLCAIVVIGRSQTAPTCSLDPAFVSSNKVGVWPDSATNFISGMVSLPYVQNITVKVPKDTTVPILGHLCFNRVTLTTPTGTVNYNLPTGLAFAVNSASLQNGTVNGYPSFQFPGNAASCCIISGTPTAAGTYTLALTIEAYMNSNSGACPATPNMSTGTKVTSQTLKYYIIKIDPYSGINETSKPDFNLSNFPNPFSNKTHIKFTVADHSPVKILVHNTLGTKVYETNINAQPGSNDHLLDAGSWNDGLYFYTIKYKNFTETKRLVLYNIH